MQYFSIFALAALCGATIQDFFADYTTGQQDPLDVVPGCYGGRLTLGADQFFFDTDNFEWSVELSVGVPNFDSMNVFIKREDPTGQFSETEMICTNQSIVVERNEDSGFVMEITVQPTDCLGEMSESVLLGDRSKLSRFALRWMPSRYVFAFNAMALVHKPHCEFLDVVYEAERVLIPVRTGPSESTETAASIFDPDVSDVSSEFAAYVQSLIEKFRVHDE